MLIGLQRPSQADASSDFSGRIAGGQVAGIVLGQRRADIVTDVLPMTGETQRPGKLRLHVTEFSVQNFKGTQFGAWFSSTLALVEPLQDRTLPVIRAG